MRSPPRAGFVVPGRCDPSLGIRGVGRPLELCGDVRNRIDTPQGWNFMMRAYHPDASVLDGSNTLPPTPPLKR